MAKRPSPLPHVKWVHSKGAWYGYFNTGQKKDGKPIYASLGKFQSPGFFDRLAALVAGRTKRQKVGYTVSQLVRDYEDSDKFRRLAQGSQKGYGVYLRKIDAQLGEFPVNDLRKSDITKAAKIEQLGPGAYNLFLAVIGAMYRWGRKEDKTTLDPVKDMDRREMGEHDPWPEEMLEAALMSDDDLVRRGTHLLFYTGQRIGDVCKMRWTDIKDGSVRVKQQKTGKKLTIKLFSALQEELDTMERRPTTILLNASGRPVSVEVLRDRLKAFCASMGHPDLKPHGLRKNAVIALLMAGCTVAETASITGQTFQVVEDYARQIDQEKMGDAAIFKLERHVNRKTVGKPALETAEKLA